MSVYSKSDLLSMKWGEVEKVDYLLFGLNVPDNYFYYEITHLSRFIDE